MLVSAFVYLLYLTLVHLSLAKDKRHMCLFYLISLPAYCLLIAPATLIALYRMARGQTGWIKHRNDRFGANPKAETENGAGEGNRPVVCSLGS